MVRRDVMSIAEKLSAKSGIPADSVYFWLMAVGKEYGTNPRNLNIDASAGVVYMVGDSDNNRLENFTSPAPWQAPSGGPDYEAAILARQDAWWGDYL